jgi:ribosomal protein L37E
MPILKVSEDLKKIAKEVIRIQITVLGDCPQCGGTNYRSGVCEDCAFISPEVMEAIKEWQESQQQGTKAAHRVAFTDLLPAADMSAKCPKCGRLGFDVNCEGCTYSEPPEGLGFHDPEFTGPSPELDIRRRFLPPGSAIKRHKDRLKKRKTKKKSSVEPGTSLDDSTVVSSDPISRIEKFQGDAAIINYELKNKGQESSNNEEQK